MALPWNPPAEWVASIADFRAALAASDAAPAPLRSAIAPAASAASAPKASGPRPAMSAIVSAPVAMPPRGITVLTVDKSAISKFPPASIASAVPALRLNRSGTLPRRPRARSAFCTPALMDDPIPSRLVWNESATPCPRSRNSPPASLTSLPA